MSRGDIFLFSSILDEGSRPLFFLKGTQGKKRLASSCISKKRQLLKKRDWFPLYTKKDDF